jgi:hypothetical protein
MAPDLFTLPHKALRAWVGATATALGGLDATVPADRTLVVARLRLVLTDLSDHGRHEDHFIVPVLDHQVPQLAQRLHDEHASIETSLAMLGALVDEFEEEPSPTLQLELYRSLRSFEGGNLAHLAFEETEVMPALWKSVTAPELVGVFQAFKAAHPEAVELYQRIPHAITPQERALVFT